MIKTKGKHTKKFIIFIFLIFILSIIILGIILVSKLKQPPPPIKEKRITKEKKKVIKKKLARIAIIIDDVGYKSNNINKYLKLNVKMAFSVLPFLPNSRYYAKLLYNAGFEIMIHVPMEPINYPKVNPGPGALLKIDSITSIKDKLAAIIRSNPYAIGANNHMGSKLTQDCMKMDAVMKILKNHNLYFIDSLTTSKSCAYKEAKKNGIKTSKRDIFLDNKKNYTYIKQQFLKLVSIAKKRGYGVGIGHIKNEKTYEVIKDMYSKKKELGIEFIFPSEIVK